MAALFEHHGFGWLVVTETLSCKDLLEVGLIIAQHLATLHSFCQYVIMLMGCSSITGSGGG